MAHPRCMEFSGLVSQATEGRQKGTTCFGRCLAAPAVCLMGQGFGQLQSDVGPGSRRLRMVVLPPLRPQEEGSLLSNHFPCCCRSSFPDERALSGRASFCLPCLLAGEPDCHGLLQTPSPVSDKLGCEGNAGLGGRDWVNGRVLSLGPQYRHHDS